MKLNVPKRLVASATAFVMAASVAFSTYAVAEETFGDDSGGFDVAADYQPEDSGGNDVADVADSDDITNDAADESVTDADGDETQTDNGVDEESATASDEGDDTANVADDAETVVDDAVNDGSDSASDDEASDDDEEVPFVCLMSTLEIMEIGFIVDAGDEGELFVPFAINEEEVITIKLDGSNIEALAAVEEIAVVYAEDINMLEDIIPLVTVEAEADDEDSFRYHIAQLASSGELIIVLTSDITINETFTDADGNEVFNVLTIDGERNITIDTNGFTLNFHAGNGTSSSARNGVLVVEDGANLIIIGGGEINIIAINAPHALLVMDEGNVEVKDDDSRLNISLTNDANFVSDNGDPGAAMEVFDGGTVTIRGNVTAKGAPGSGWVFDGEYWVPNNNMGMRGIWAGDNGTVNMYGNITVEGENSVVADMYGNAENGFAEINIREGLVSVHGLNGQLSRSNSPLNALVFFTDMLDDGMGLVVDAPGYNTANYMTGYGTIDDVGSRRSSDSTDTVSLQANAGAMGISVQMTSDNAALILAHSALSELTRNAVQGVVTLDLSMLGNTRAAVLSRTAMRHFACENLGLAISLPQGTVELDAAAVRFISQRADVNVSITIVTTGTSRVAVISSGGRALNVAGSVTVR
jgi:hypothetical protein